MYRLGPSYSVKYICIASILSFALLFWVLGLHENAALHVSAAAERLWKPLQSSTQFGSKYPLNNVLPPEYAVEYCERYRLQAFSPERVTQRKVYDLLLVNTEVELLEIRLGQMAPYVDYFVVLESDKTFTGNDKPLYIRENWDLFKRWHDKIILRTLDVKKIDLNGGAWDREAKSRNAMYDQVVPFLTEEQAPQMGDVLLVSDVDEIPKPEVLRALRNCDFPKLTAMHSEFYYFSFQWEIRAEWLHPQATVYLGEETVLPDELRRNGRDFVFRRGAWHCSYCFSTIKEMVAKITSFSHSEYDKPEFKNESSIVWRARMGYDIFARADSSPIDRIEDNQDIPEYIKLNREKFSFMVDRDPPNGNFRDYGMESDQLPLQGRRNEH